MKNAGSNFASADLPVIVILILILIAGCGKSGNVPENSGSGNSQTENQSTQLEETVMINLPTMQCGTCKKNIESAVKKIEGVKNVNVSVKEKNAKVEFDKGKTNLNQIEGVIVMTGYQANDKPADKNAYDKLEDCCKIGGH